MNDTKIRFYLKSILLLTFAVVVFLGLFISPNKAQALTSVVVSCTKDIGGQTAQLCITVYTTDLNYPGWTGATTEVNWGDGKVTKVDDGMFFTLPNTGFANSYSNYFEPSHTYISLTCGVVNTIPLIVHFYISYYDINKNFVGYGTDDYYNGSVNVAGPVCSPVKPGSFTVSTAGCYDTGRFDLSWGASSNADRYDVYRHAWTTGSWTYDGTTTGTSYTAQEAMDTDWYFKVTAVNSAGSTDSNELYGGNCPTPVVNAPTCSGGAPQSATTTATSGGFFVYAYGVTNATSVYFPTWSSVNGQDDIVWYPGANQGGGTWRATVDLGNHRAGNPDYGQFYTHIYMNNSAYTNTWCGTANFVRNNPTPPPPTNLILSCPSPGTTVNASWTPPSGYSTFYLRANPGANNGTWPSAVIQDNVVGPSSSFVSTAGQTYYVWVHTRDPVTGAWSTDIHDNVACIFPPPTAAISANPNPVNYNTASSLTWTSTNTVANSCSITGGSVVGGSTGLPVSGSKSTTNLTAPATYTVTCQGLNGSPVSANVTVTVSAPVPTISNVTATEPNYCVSGPAVTISWIYSDPAGSPQSAYQVQITNTGSFINPILDTGKVINSGPSAYLTGLQFNTTYKARVMVWNGYNVASAWSNSSNTWKTPPYAYPQPDFSWTANGILNNPSPPLNKPVQFTDTTVFNGNPNGRRWDWLFGDGGTSTTQNPSHTYVTEGSYYLTLTATDNANQSCAKTTKTKGPIIIQKPIPRWREIAPK